MLKLKVLCVNVPFDSLDQIHLHKLSNLAEMAKSCHFPKHEYIRDSQYPFDSGSGWGLFVFHKCFQVFFLVSFVGLNVRSRFQNSRAQSIRNFILERRQNVL